MSQVFKRMYVDIPAETHDRLKKFASDNGMSQKATVAKLIEDAVSQAKSPPKRKRKPAKKRGKKRGKKTSKKTR